ncbi:MAG: ABC transporter permease, partial [Chlorobiaceae bacterium]|nr:ABC transporter permease [Chlorobiaceae bacterium]
MQSFRGFLIKEFYHIFRDRRTALILFGMPLIQLLLFGFAIRNEILDVKIGLYDRSHDVVTKEIIDKITSSGTFVIKRELHTTRDIEEAFASGSINEAIVFEPGFAERLQREGKADVQVINDGSNPNLSKIVAGYTASVLQDFRSANWNGADTEKGVVALPLMMFNPELKSVDLFVPGLMALILMLVSALMTSISITREKESGTMEVLLVSSLRPAEIIVGKVVPYFLLSIVNVLTVLAVASLVFGVPCRGSLILLILESLLFIVTALSLGIFISSITGSQ